MMRVHTYSKDGKQLRLCTEHVRERREAGENIRVPIIDQVAFLHLTSGRYLGPRPCVDCKEGS